MLAAISAARNQKKVLVLEKGERPGRKILASGNGRCNLMNTGSPRYYGEQEFARQVLERVSADDIKHFLMHYGLFVTEEENGRIYPMSFQSASVLSVLKTALDISGVSVITHQSVISAEKKDNAFLIHTGSGDTFSAGRFIVTCGGCAQPRLGGSVDGYKILRSFGHTIVPPFPALVPLTADARSISGLAGIRARCGVSLYHDGEQLHSEEGEILFTDYGVSGICIMQCARFAQGHHNACLEVDFLRNSFSDDAAAFDELRRRQLLFGMCSPIVLLDGIVSEKIAFAILKQAGIRMRYEKCYELTDTDLRNIVHSAYRYRIHVTGTRGFDYAQVSAGGARCSEFNPVTMESRIVPGLYAAGEVLNVDGDCGGYNLMFAMASGITAGNAVS
jgi:hypothetical protein